MSTLVSSAEGVDTVTSNCAALGSNAARAVRENLLLVLPPLAGCMWCWSSFVVWWTLDVGLCEAGKALFGGGVPVGTVFETGAMKVALELLVDGALDWAGVDTASGLSVKSISAVSGAAASAGSVCALRLLICAWRLRSWSCVIVPRRKSRLSWKAMASSSGLVKWRNAKLVWRTMCSGPPISIGGKTSPNIWICWGCVLFKKPLNALIAGME